MVDLSKLKVGDTVKFRNGTSELVYDLRTSPYHLMVNHSFYYYKGDSNRVPRYDIVEIIPKESEVLYSKATQKIMDDNVAAMNKLANTHGLDVVQKPKRFVDLLAENVEYIECTGVIYRANSEYKIVEYWNMSDKIWNTPHGITYSLLLPATPTQNPERKKKVVYNVLMQPKDKKEFYISAYKYTSLQECQRQHFNTYALRLIEESREEIEE